MIGRPVTTHLGHLERIPEWGIWRGMRQRCSNPNLPGYKYYGGRGISVCSRWQQSFLNFYADLGPRPSPLHCIERINNDGNYEPNNCKWATRAEQSKNRRIKKTVLRNCAWCHTEIEVKRFKLLKYKNSFCNHSCAMKFMRRQQIQPLAIAGTMALPPGPQ